MAARKHLHWTQTPEGRKQQSKRMKAQHKNGGLKKHAGVVAHIGAEHKLSARDNTYTLTFKRETDGDTKTIGITGVARNDLLKVIGILMGKK